MLWFSFLDSQEEFLYSPSHKKQHLIKIVLLIALVLGGIYAGLFFICLPLQRQMKRKNSLCALCACGEYIFLNFAYYFKKLGLYQEPAAIN